MRLYLDISSKKSVLRFGSKVAKWSSQAAADDVLTVYLMDVHGNDHELPRFAPISDIISALNDTLNNVQHQCVAIAIGDTTPDTALVLGLFDQRQALASTRFYSGKDPISCRQAVTAGVIDEVVA